MAVCPGGGSFHCSFRVTVFTPSGNTGNTGLQAVSIYPSSGSMGNVLLLPISMWVPQPTLFCHVAGHEGTGRFEALFICGTPVVLPDVLNGSVLKTI